MSYLSNTKGINIPIIAAKIITTNKETLPTTPSIILSKILAIPKIKLEQIIPFKIPTNVSLDNLENTLLN